jgi:prepilin peptidase CpaA
METLFAMAVAAPMTAACVTDVRRRLIPDLAVAAIALLALAQALASGTLASALASGAACLLVGSAAARIGFWGWGDAKLIGACGLAVGLSGLPYLLLGTAIAGGVLAALMLLLRAPVVSGRMALPAGAPRWLRAEQTRLRRAPTIPYALAIATGLATAFSVGA